MAVPTERLELMTRGRGVLSRPARRTRLTTTLFAPSALPDWSRAHVVSHFSRNAAALINLLDWARTGVATPMYPSVEARVRGHRGRRPSVRCRAARRGRASVERGCRRRRPRCPTDAWDGEIRTALGRETTGAEVPWMRIRENWVHTVDLDAGATVDDFPPRVVVDLLDEVTGFVAGRDGCPAAILDATDTDRRLDESVPRATPSRSRAPRRRCSPGSSAAARARASSRRTAWCPRPPAGSSERLWLSGRAILGLSTAQTSLDPIGPVTSCIRQCATETPSAATRSADSRPIHSPSGSRAM